MDTNRMIFLADFQEAPINCYNKFCSDSKISIMFSIEDSNTITLNVKDDINNEIIQIKDICLSDVKYLYNCFKRLLTERREDTYIDDRNDRLRVNTEVDNKLFNVAIKDFKNNDLHHLTELNLVDCKNLMMTMRIYTMILPER